MARYLEAQPVRWMSCSLKRPFQQWLNKNVFALWPADCLGRDVWSGKRSDYGAMLYEGWATSQQDAENQITQAKSTLPLVIIITRLAQWQHHQPVDAVMGGRKQNQRPSYFSNFNEGLGKVLRFGANNDEFSIVWPGCAMNWRRQ